MALRRLVALWWVTVSLASAQKTDYFTQAMTAGERTFAQYNYNDALAAFRKATILKPNSSEAQVELANTLILIARTGQQNSTTLQEAKQAEQKVLEMVPNNAEALAGLGEIEYLSGLHPGNLFGKSAKLESAVRLLNNALAIDATNYHALYALTRIEARQIQVVLLAVMKFPSN
jgi:tetratricopeptide (TPR) repeat protein